jgi:hypothetical protein
MAHDHVQSPLTGCGMAFFIRVFDLEAAEYIANSQRDRFTETGSSKTPPTYFRSQLQTGNKQDKIEKNDEGKTKVFFGDLIIN